MKRLADMGLKEKRALVRCDFNVALNFDGSIADNFKILKTLPTLRYLIEQKAKVICMTHLGEPEGKVVEHLRVTKIQEELEKLLEMPILKADDCIGTEVEKQILAMKAGEILLLENVRFHPGEETNDPEFARQLANLGEVYINDAFAECHRSYASIIGLPALLPHGAGLLLEKEIENLDKILKHPVHPLVVLIGGAKSSTKAPLVKIIASSADHIIVNGLIKKELHKEHIENAEKIIGPEKNLDGLDLAEEEITIMKEAILKAKTIFWNGPFGKFEDERYQAGTRAIANAIVESGAFSVVGGGETLEFLKHEGLLEKFGWASTGGGAMLAYVSGEELPGIKALE